MTTGSIGGGAAAVPGANKQVIYNDSGVLAGDSGLTYDKTTDALTVAGLITGLNNLTLSNGYAVIDRDTGNLNLGNKTANQQVEIWFRELSANRWAIYKDASQNLAIYTDLYGNAFGINRTNGIVWMNTLVGTGSRVVQADAGGFLSATQPLGLTLITSGVIAAGSTTANINGCFSSAYRNYRLVLAEVDLNTAVQSLCLRFNTAGTPDASNNYYWGLQWVTQLPGTNYNGAIQTFAQVLQGMAGGRILNMGMVCDITSPNINGYWTNFYVMGGGIHTGYALAINYGGGTMATNTSSYTGITLFPASGTFGCRYYVYGYGGS